MTNTIKTPHIIRRSAILAALAVFVVSGSAHAVNFSKSEKAKLKSGKTVVQLLPSSGKKGFYGGSGFALVDAPIDEVWEVIRSWKNYSAMFPNTEYCQPVSRKGNRTLLKMKIGHPVVNIRFHVEVTEDSEKKSLLFNLVTQYPHDIDSLKGYWRLFPQKGGRTLVAYVASVKAPMGVIAIAGEDLAQGAIEALLKIPGDVRRWMKSPKYRKRKR